MTRVESVEAVHTHTHTHTSNFTKQNKGEKAFINNEQNWGRLNL